MSLKPRKEMDPRFMWDFSHIFADHAAWEKAYAEAEKAVENAGSFKGRIASDAETLADGLDAIYGASEKVELVGVYAFLHKEADGSDPENQNMEARATGLSVKFGSLVSYCEPEMLSVGADTLRRYLDECPRLATYRHMIEDLIRSSAHILDAAREEMMAQLGDAFRVPTEVYGMLTNVDMELPAVIGENGEEMTLTHGNFGVFRENKCRAVREDAFEKCFGTYKKYINTFAAAYAGEVKMNSFNASVRGYSSACEAALAGGNVPVSVYDALTEAIHNALPTMRKYIDLRAKVMGKEKIDMFDLYVPMVEDVDYPMPYEDAKVLVKKALAPFGEEYAALLDRAYSENWIDVYENKGKRSGAFSCGVYGVHPYVLLNYTDTLDDAFTLAHELGHAMHSHFSSAAQDYANHDYRIMVAEVASTVNEVMLTKYLLKTETDPRRRAYVLNHFLEGFRATVFRQTLFAEFERKAHDAYAAGQPLTAVTLSGIYKDLISTYYEGAGINDVMQYEWSYIPHFYRNFYVYQYATGFCSAVAIAGKIADGGDTADYMKFLSLGGSDYPLEELKVAGIDLTKPDTVADAMKIFDESIDELAKILLG